MKKSFMLASVVASLLLVALTAIVIERGQFIEVQRALHASEVVSLNEEIIRLKESVAGWEKRDGEWRSAAAPAFARMSHYTLHGETPEGLADALNPCFLASGAWSATCMLLRIERGNPLPIRIEHREPLKLD